MCKFKLRWFVYAAIAVSTVAVISDSHAQTGWEETQSAYTANPLPAGSYGAITSVTLADMAQNCADNWQSGPPGYTGEAALITALTAESWNGSAWVAQISVGCVWSEGGTFVNTGYSWHSDDCNGDGTGGSFPCAPPPGECDGAGAGERFQQVFYGTGSAPASLCDTASNCLSNRGAGMCLVSSGDCIFDYTVSATTCSTPDSTIPAASDNTLCVSSGAGTICVDPNDVNNASGSNCIFYNDSYVCTDQAANDNCVGLIDGSLGCDDTAPAPPAPDDGITPGVPAAPDEQLSDGPGDVTNIYDNSTVNGSTGPTSGSDQGDGSSDSGEGTGGCDPATEYCGDGTYTAGTNCDVPPVCAGEAILCGIVLENWRAGCQDVGTPAEILADTGLTGLDDATALDGLPVDLSSGLDDSGWFGTRTCDLDLPVDLGFFGEHTFIFSQWCSLFAFGGVLVLVSAGLGSLRIIAGGF